MSFVWLRNHKYITTLLVLLSMGIVFGVGAFFVYSQHNSSKPRDTSGASSPVNTVPNNVKSATTVAPETTNGNQSSNTTTPKKTTTPYHAMVCTKTITPRETEYHNNGTMYVGESKVDYEGLDGWVSSCTPDSEGQTSADIVTPPSNRRVSVGTKPLATTPPPSSGISYQQAQANCSALGTGNTSAWEQCMHAYGY